MNKRRIGITSVIGMIAIVLCTSAASLSAPNASSSESILTFRLVHPHNDELSKLPSSAIKIDRRQYEHLVDQNGGSYWVDRKIELDTKDIKAVKIIFESFKGPYSSAEREDYEVTPEFITRNPQLKNVMSYRVRLFFTESGAGKFRVLTRKNVKRRLAVIFDGRVLEAPIIFEEMDDVADITGPLTYKDALRLKDAIDGRGNLIVWNN